MATPDQERRLDALSPFDGRYAQVGEKLSPYFSEGGLIHIRTFIELRYLRALSGTGIIRSFKDEELHLLERLEYPDVHAQIRVKEIEKVTHHDVQAVVVFLQETLKDTSLRDIAGFIHFGLTSEDVNNLSTRISLLRARNDVIVPSMNALIKTLADYADAYKALPMLARTHGQPAVPTTFGKEISTFAARLHKQREALTGFVFQGKLNGAVGNFNALAYAYPEIDWIQFSENFTRLLGFEPVDSTTQVNPNDDIASYLQIIERFNLIVHGFDRDMWRYISDDLVIQKAEGVGSSTMPQKINPIDFEHSEGMTEMANGMIRVLTTEVVESRLQRDLSDTPLFRFLGDIHAATIDAWEKTAHGIGRSSPDETSMHAVLWKNWAILSEPIQLLLKQNGHDQAHELIRKHTQGKQFREKEWKKMVEQIIADFDISDDQLLRQLRELTPDMYVGYAVQLTERVIEEVRSAQR